MAWAALIPIAAQLLKGDEKPAAAPQALPPSPSIGDVMANNQAKYNNSTQHSYPTQSNPFSQFPIGGGQKGPNG